jgi:hypothetical protein
LTNKVNTLKRDRQSTAGHIGLVVLGIWFMAGPDGCAQQGLQVPEEPIWQEGIGHGFESGVQTLTVEAGANYGLAILGGHEAHHLGLVSLSYGHMRGDVVGKDHWYRGNFEWRAEIFTGMQFSPEDDWLVGLTPHLRYNLATGTRWVPFLDGGAGVTATGIGPPDLSNIFEFNLQMGLGAHWFLQNDLALTAEARFIHISCAHLSQPNDGLNGVMGLIGLTWLF